jgi:nicotinamide mononucleotide adenylyltransferase
MKIAIFPGSFKPPHYGHYTLVDKLLQDKTIDKVYIIISPIPRDKITAQESEKIWKIYFGNKYDKKLYIMISKLNSPIQMAYAIANNVTKKGDILILVKSTKNEKNTRFDMFKSLEKKGIKLKLWTIPQFDTLSSTNMRKSIYDNDKQNFIKFLPLHLSQNNKNKIWNILHQ